MAQNLSHDLYTVCVGNGIYSFTEEGLLKGSHCPKINLGKEADLPPQKYVFVMLLCLLYHVPLFYRALVFKAGDQTACSNGIPCFPTWAEVRMRGKIILANLCEL